MKESAIVRQILHGLAAEHIFAFRLNSAAFSVDNRFFKAHSLGLGAADILALPITMTAVNCEDKEILIFSPTWIEVKTIKGRQSPEQKSFQAYVELLGHRYVIARSFDDVRALWLERCQGVEK